MLAGPEDRRKQLRVAADHIGAKLQGFWHIMGANGAYALFEASDDITAESLFLRAYADGSFTSMSTVKLMSVEDELEAMKLGGVLRFRGPGEPG
jgi:uncharacterized protein with GYD domain